MSTLALMRFLEAAPDRYDRGMRWLTLGRVDAIRDALVAGLALPPGAQVLELGCGTGSTTLRLAAGGARVTALDTNPAMLALARQRLREGTGCTLQERAACEIDGLPRAAFDAVVATFSLSEMAPEERRFVLEQARLRLRPGGRLAVADEVRPRTGGARLAFALLRAPQALLTWLLVGSVSRPLDDLEQEIRAAGFEPTAHRSWLGGHLALWLAEPRG